MGQCHDCRFAEVTTGTRVITLPDGGKLVQSGRNNYVCKRPGGAKNITITNGELDCSSHERKVQK